MPREVVASMYGLFVRRIVLCAYSNSTLSSIGDTNALVLVHCLHIFHPLLLHRLFHLLLEATNGVGAPLSRTYERAMVTTPEA